MDLEKEVSDLKEDVAGMKSDIRNLKDWQKAQNGTIHAVDRKVDGLIRWMMAAMGGIITSILVSLVKG
ncbi:MAG: hypothetical protein K6T65_11745 [Peptococcaceae bacterium]|nr:hypothetical protein [Peptococcaceae bacterium]